MKDLYVAHTVYDLYWTDTTVTCRKSSADGLIISKKTKTQIHLLNQLKVILLINVALASGFYNELEKENWTNINFSACLSEISHTLSIPSVKFF